ncbi:hypothetical protein [Coleofasciculus sp. FACHB-1120]|uniref:hypothetical protein n=1 Tax=Coleofasciculus sp. FACHB-1120 TaxID=2692783 RepID=UPI00168602A3|nr:hypothetical protein [Coleofasciculus sp. FACHB-1120]MBD2743853.1 hypothetical protein [Coleofasciculus sp. FACHB-1120]
MNFKSFSELREFIRRYNSTSVLEIGTKKCWQIWETQPSAPVDWVKRNAERNYAVRLMLLASAGNPHRRENISVQAFDNLINAYHNWSGHTISEQYLLEKEAEVLLSSLTKWESDNKTIVKNWSLELSKVFDLGVIRNHVAYLFFQRIVSFQNAGFGYPISRIRRTIKFIELLDNYSEKNFSNEVSRYTKLNHSDYFKQILGCLALFKKSKKQGFCNLSQFANLIDEEVHKLGITPENLEIFVKQNSAVLTTQVDNSFRRKVNQTFGSVPNFYQPFFYNHFLEIPFVELNHQEFCLPDPFSFTESCWNQIRGITFKDNNRKKLEQLLSSAFEDYLENVLLPVISPDSFNRIPEVRNTNSNKDKRADFIINTPSSYIVLECKSSVMSSDTSAYFQADKVADLWCRIHSAFEQISRTVQALNLHDKPVIPLVLTFYDSIAAASVFEEMIKQTDYCSRMGMNVPPVVHSLHEFEHWISDRSLNNWAELILSKQNGHSSIKPDNKGHDYKHLNSISIL